MAAAIPLAIAATGFGLSCYSPAVEETAVCSATTAAAAIMAVTTTVANG